MHRNHPHDRQHRASTDGSSRPPTLRGQAAAAAALVAVLWAATHPVAALAALAALATTAAGALALTLLASRPWRRLVPWTPPDPVAE